MHATSYSLSEIAEFLGAELVNASENQLIAGLATLLQAQSDQISFLESKQYLPNLKTTQAGAVILRSEHAKDCPTACLIVKNPYVAYAKLTSWFNNAPIDSFSGIHSTAIIHPSAQIHPTVSVGAYAVIESDVHIGPHTQVGAHCYVGQRVTIGANSVLHSQVKIYYDCLLGDEVNIHSGTVIGADGFGFANDQGKWIKIHQLGKVVIGNRVDIGANTCIDRGALKDTLISDDVIIDNLVQIAHNVEIGRRTAIAGCTGIAGSTKIGEDCRLGGGVNINGHIEICDKVSIVGATTVYRSITEPGAYSSPITALPFKDWLRSLACFQRLPEIAQTISKFDNMLLKLPKWVKKFLKIDR